MRRIRAFSTLAVATGILLSAPAPEVKSVSVADCQFAADPDAYLGRALRIRRAASDRTARLNRALARPAAAADSIPQRNYIDQEILGKLAKLGVPSAPLSDDEEFLRRITLDLTGRLPSAADIRAFLADITQTRRDAAIDRLLASPEFTDRWTMWMGDLLQNTSTLANAAVNRNQPGRNAFHAYIKDAVATGRSLRTVAAEVITGKGNNYDNGSGAANFPLGASTAMGPVQDTYDTMLVRTASIFLGIGHYDCLLCHSGRGHLDQVSLWGYGQTRAQAESMAAHFSRMVFTASQPNGSFTVSEAPAGGYDLNTNSGNRPDRVPLASARSLTPLYRDSAAEPSGDDWRAAFATAMAQDPMFARNLANRIWKQMFGLGLVEPVDGLDPARLDPGHPPSAPWELQATHPELLEKLAADLAQQDFQLRPFLRTLVQSSAYQLSSNYGGAWKVDYVALFARHFARRLEGEEVHDAITGATGVGGSYAIQGWADRIAWAMQLPEPLEPRGDATANNFMNQFLRGNRDSQGRSQDGSIQQQLYLMNDAFVTDRTKVARSPRLQAIAQISGNPEVVEEIYLTFLSRRPSGAERASALVAMANAASPNDAVEDLAWVCINKVDFLFSY